MTGFGNVGRSMAQLLSDHGDEYDARYGVRLLLTGVADRGGAVADPAGLDAGALLRAKADVGSVAASAGDRSGQADEDFLRRSKADVFIEAASTNFEDAEPGWSLLRSALSLDMV